MSAPTPRHDVAAAVAVTAWIVGMGLVMILDDDAWQMVGACLWALGLAVAVIVAAHAYRTRSRYTP
jgi:peptidoglycan/LPS O-acetylase OafA/YrhL